MRLLVDMRSSELSEPIELCHWVTTVPVDKGDGKAIQASKPLLCQCPQICLNVLALEWPCLRGGPQGLEQQGQQEKIWSLVRDGRKVGISLNYRVALI